VWAPDVIYVNGLYYLYYSVAGLTSSTACVIGLLTSPTLNPSSPNYKWTDRGLVVQNPPTTPEPAYSTIDPAPVLDLTGTLWLGWGSGYGKDFGLTQLWATRMNATGLADTTDPVYQPPGTPGHPIEPGRKEGSYLHYNNGYFYLFYNEGSCCDGVTSTYTIWVARSQSLTGPYTGDKVFYGSNGNINGPGHMGIYSACGVERFTYHYYPTATSVLGENELSWARFLNGLARTMLLASLCGACGTSGGNAVSVGDGASVDASSEGSETGVTRADSSSTVDSGDAIDARGGISDGGPGDGGTSSDSAAPGDTGGPVDPTDAAEDAVSLPGTNNPVLPGLNADPQVALFGSTFYIYPTTDGFAGWDSTSFSVFSSTNLVQWANGGVILDLPKDLTWATGHAWAPSITKVGATYYFYFYFCADSQIGVATSSSPTGPFKDALGHPLITTKQYGTQSIDPYVFIDDDATPYLYFGSGTGGARLVKLNADMISFTGTPTNISPSGASGVIEGSVMFKRNGSYCLQWSEGDTLDADYQVAYARAQSPAGPFNRVGPILQENTTLGIFATGGTPSSRSPAEMSITWCTIDSRSPAATEPIAKCA
jgi:beta-xylosidase